MTEKLSDLKIRKLERPAGLKRSKRISDGGNLFLVLTPNGSKVWSFIYRDRDGKSPECGGGAYPDVSLRAARLWATEGREMLSRNLDPKKEWEKRRKPVKAEAPPTFGEAMEEFLAVKGHEWKSKKNAKHIGALMRRYCKPILDVPADQIGTKDVLKIVKPVFLETPVQGPRLLRLIETTLDTAHVLGDADNRRANPARWRGHLDRLLPRRKKGGRKNYAAMPYAQAPAFIAELRNLRQDPSTGTICIAAFALEFLILTATRTSEVLGALWSEIDFEDRLWRVPAVRMKAGRDHVVPLSEAAIALLAAIPRVDENPFVFPGHGHHRRPGERRRDYSPAPMSDKTFLRLLERTKHAAVTVHGFRSTFRDWSGEETSFAREIAEWALAHQVGDETERAYRRGDALARRAELMSTWADYLGGSISGNVVKFPKRA
jgi:integrase